MNRADSYYTFNCPFCENEINIRLQSLEKKSERLLTKNEKDITSFFTGITIALSEKRKINKEKAVEKLKVLLERW